MIFAHGSRFGGHALFVKDGKLTYVYNFLGIPPEQRIARRRAGVRARTSSASSSPRNGWASTTSRIGPLKLYVDDEVVAEAEIRTHDRALLASAARASASATTAATRSAPSTRRGSSSPAARSSRSCSTSRDDAYVDVEAHLAAAMARD